MSEENSIPINEEAEQNNTSADELLNKTSSSEQLLALEEEKTKLIKELDNLKDKYIRGQAEIANIRTRSEQEILKAKQFGSQSLIKALFPVIDSLEKAIENCKEDKQGLEMTLSLLIEVLRKEGVEVVNPEKELFDPKFHEAISIENNTEIKTNTVTKVLQKGYKMKERSLRTALVIVNK